MFPVSSVWPAGRFGPKFRGYMRRLIPLLFVSAAHAELLSEHNEQHAATQSARNRLYDAGCIRTLDTRSEQFKVHSTPDRGAYNISGVTITTRCVKWIQPVVAPSPVVVDHVLTWRHADRRTDGTVLTLSEIAGYEVEHNGQVILVGLVTSYTITDTADSRDDYRIRTIDNFGQRGPWSNHVRL